MSVLYISTPAQKESWLYYSIVNYCILNLFRIVYDILYFNFSKNIAISNLLNFADKIKSKGIKKLRNAETVKLIIEYLGMLHKYVKQPSMHIVFCEDFFFKFMVMTYSEYGRDLARLARKENYVELMFDVMQKAIIHDFKKAELIDYSLFPHLRHKKANTYMMFWKPFFSE